MKELAPYAADRTVILNGEVINRFEHVLLDICPEAGWNGTDAVGRDQAGPGRCVVRRPIVMEPFVRPGGD